MYVLMNCPQVLFDYTFTHRNSTCLPSSLNFLDFFIFIIVAIAINGIIMILLMIIVTIVINVIIMILLMMMMTIMTQVIKRISMEFKNSDKLVRSLEFSN